MHQFRFKVSDKVYNIRCLIKSNESDYCKINAIYEKLFSFNDGFHSFDFICKNQVRMSNIRIETNKMRLVERLKGLLNLSYDIMISIYPDYQKTDNVSLNVSLFVNKIKCFIESPDDKSYKDILKIIKQIDLKCAEFINKSLNDKDSYYKIFQFISAMKSLLEIIKSLVESDKLNIDCFKGFIKSFCSNNLEKVPEQLNICCKHITNNYHDYLY